MPPPSPHAATPRVCWTSQVFKACLDRPGAMSNSRALPHRGEDDHHSNYHVTAPGMASRRGSSRLGT